jgi:hypothetical protein
MIYNIPSTFSTSLVFNVTLDEGSYTLTVYQQYYANRLYFTVTDYSGKLIITRPLISSDFDVNNLENYFDTKLYYSETDQVIKIV